MLTQQQKHMLTVLIDHFNDHDVPPSFEELCKIMDLKSKSGIHRLLSGLEERGYIRRLPNRARAIEVLKYPDGSPKTEMATAPISQDIAPPSEAVTIPLLGKIAAGTPIAAISNPSIRLTCRHP